MTHPSEAVGVRARLPIGLQRVFPGHRPERTARSRRVGTTKLATVVVAIAAIVGAAACSDSVDPNSSSPTTVACAPGTAPTSGAVPQTVVPIDGTGDGNVGLPANLTLPLIVHAHHVGNASFIVRGVDAQGKDTHVLATALGPYDGTFAVGFVDPCNSPTIALHIETKNKWHLDIGDARNSPQYQGALAGKGDAVLLYVGTASKTSVSYTGGKHFVLTTFGAEGPKLLAESAKPYLGTVSLANGPVFIVVTAEGSWTLRSA